MEKTNWAYYSFVGFTMVFGMLSCGTLVVNAITCEECLQKDKNMQIVKEKLTKKTKELKEALDAKRFRKIRLLNKEILELKKEQLKLTKDRGECREACSPDVLKENQCNDLKVKIVEKEAKGSLSKDEITKIDEMYRELQQCNRQLKRIKASRR